MLLKGGLNNLAACEKTDDLSQEYDAVIEALNSIVQSLESEL